MPRNERIRLGSEYVEHATAQPLVQHVLGLCAAGLDPVLPRFLMLNDVIELRIHLCQWLIEGLRPLQRMGKAVTRSGMKCLFNFCITGSIRMHRGD